MAFFGLRRTGAAVAALTAVAALAALYGITRGAGNRDAAACPASASAAAALKPLVHGEVAAFIAADRPKPLPDLAFEDAEGRPRRLADWRGRTVLLNLWATWCVPCRREMPALDRLQAKLGGAGFEVVAVNLDTQGKAKADKFLKETGIGRLGFYADASMKLFQDLKAQGRAPGLPTTLLIGPDGCEMGYLPGPAEWDSPDAATLLEAALKGSGAAKPPGA